MGWFNSFLNRLFPVDRTVGASADTVVIDIPAMYYYRELAVYTAVSLISNAISRSEIKCYVDGKPVKNEDYYRLNVSPNRNETSSVFWHKVINQMTRRGEALVVEISGRLYCADSYVREKEQPILGDVFSGVQIGNLALTRRFTRHDSYLFRLDNINVTTLINGMYEDYGPLIAAAASAYKNSNGMKYKLHVNAVKAGDPEFNKEFEEVIMKQLKTFMSADKAVYPEFEGYELIKDPAFTAGKSSEDFTKLRDDMFTMVAGCFHIPQSMMTGNITNIKDIVSSFLTFGVDPFADALAEGLNKAAGPENFVAGSLYKVDTGRIAHRDIFDLAPNISGIIGSGVTNIDEVREELGREPIGKPWSRKHFITKNFEEVERFLKGVDSSGEGG